MSKTYRINPAFTRLVARRSPEEVERALRGKGMAKKPRYKREGKADIERTIIENIEENND